MAKMDLWQILQGLYLLFNFFSIEFGFIFLILKKWVMLFKCRREGICWRNSLSWFPVKSFRRFWKLAVAMAVLLFLSYGNLIKTTATLLSLSVLRLWFSVELFLYIGIASVFFHFTHVYILDFINIFFTRN
jgi:hypothetical protein